MPRASVALVPTRISRPDGRTTVLALPPAKANPPGNTLILWELDRLGRGLRHLVNTVEDLRTRSIGLKVMAGAGAQIDTTTANDRLAFGIFAALAEPAIMRIGIAGLQLASSQVGRQPS